MTEPAQNLRWGVVKRLEFIELRLYWDGMLRRKDLTDQFEISVPQASADIAEYQERAPGNIEYDASRKGYIPSANFTPRFYNPSAEDYFSRLQQDQETAGVSKEMWLGWTPPLGAVPTIRREASAATLRKTIQAIKNSRAIYIHYQSVSSSEPTWRWITPHALGFDGFRWHVRAWCHLREAYRDFVIARMLKITKDREESINPADDLEWNQYVTFRIGPNPELSAATQEIISMDYAMTNGELKVKTRASLSWYVERYLGLDLNQYRVPAERQQIVLLNKSEIDEIRTKLKARSKNKAQASGVPFSPAL
jgi:predicted DNA-binding transcriptional regulator YafY